MPRFIKAEGAVFGTKTARATPITSVLRPAIVGHPEVIEAVREAALGGLSFGAPTEGEIVIAEEIAKIMPSVERLRLVSSGTEATMTAIRLARGFTGRDKSSSSKAATTAIPTACSSKPAAACSPAARLPQAFPPTLPNTP